LLFYRARYYDSRLQRFLSSDSIDFACGDSNLYAYVGNRPTLLTDPEGFCPVCPVVVVANPGAAAAAAGAAAAAAAATMAAVQAATKVGAYMGRVARCWRQYNQDVKACNKLSDPQDQALCFKQAMDRYVACKNGNWVPPLRWPE
jgi:uncharacterized protein RhaS with RHS repeats